MPRPWMLDNLYSPPPRDSELPPQLSLRIFWETDKPRHNAYLVLTRLVFFNGMVLAES